MTRLARASGIVQRQLTDGLLVLAPASDAPVLLAGSAGPLWEALANPRRQEELVAAMQRLFRGDPDRIAGDVAATLETLLENRLVEVAEP